MKDFDATSYLAAKGDFNTADEKRLISYIRNADKVVSILDVGCGDGRLTKRVQSACPNCLVTGIDNSSDQITLSKAAPSSITFELVGIENFHPSQAFDMVYSFYAFPHMPKSLLPAALAGVRRSLKRGGSFYLFTNICLFDTSTATPEDQEACDIEFLDHFHSQINLIDMSEMQTLLTNAGFSIGHDEGLETGARVKEYGDMISWLFVLR